MKELLKEALAVIISKHEPKGAPTPKPPTDAELVAMFNALPTSEKMAKLGVKL